jgi:hypothetical protein
VREFHQFHISEVITLIILNQFFKGQDQRPLIEQELTVNSSHVISPAVGDAPFSPINHRSACFPEAWVNPISLSIQLGLRRPQLYLAFFRCTAQG